MRLYNYPDCPYCQKVRVVLAEKDLSYETAPIDLRKNEQKTPEFLRLNPYGKVPVLEDEEIVIYESTIINEYLEDEYPIPALMPSDSAGRARVRMLEDYGDNIFLPQTSLVLAELARPEGERDGEKLNRYRAGLVRSLEWLNSSLEGREYLVNDFSIADIAFVPGVLILANMGIEANPSWKNLAAWLGRLRQRASIQALGL